MLTGVSETLLIPLYMRAKDEALGDRLAQDWISEIDYDFSRFEDSHVRGHGVRARTRLIDNEIQDLQRQSDALAVINIGSGLCTRFNRLQDGKTLWIELDLPEVGPVWRSLNEETDLHRFIEASAFDLQWMDQIEAWTRGRSLVFVSEGVLFYFPEDKIKLLITGIANRFPEAHLILQIASREFAYRRFFQDANIRATSALTEVTGTWGVDDGREICEWHPRLQFIHQKYHDAYFVPFWRRLLTLRFGRKLDGRVVRLKVSSPRL